MKLSTYMLAIGGLTTSVLASPVLMRRSADLKFIWEWYEEKEAGDVEDTSLEKRSADLKPRAPIGQFIWEWYGEKDAGDVMDEEAEA